MTETVKITSIIYPEVVVKRGDGIATGSDVQVWLDDFLFVSIGYDYRYTSNASQWRLAEQIAAAFRRPAAVPLPAQVVPEGMVLVPIDAVKPFTSGGGNWGAIKAWIVHHAPEQAGRRTIGIEEAAWITRSQAALDKALAASAPTAAPKGECCNKTVIQHCEGCPYIPVARCTCFRCLSAWTPASEDRT